MNPYIIAGLAAVGAWLMFQDKTKPSKAKAEESPEIGSKTPEKPHPAPPPEPKDENDEDTPKDHTE